MVDTGSEDYNDTADVLVIAALAQEYFQDLIQFYRSYSILL